MCCTAALPVRRSGCAARRATANLARSAAALLAMLLVLGSGCAGSGTPDVMLTHNAAGHWMRMTSGPREAPGGAIERGGRVLDRFASEREDLLTPIEAEVSEQIERALAGRRFERIIHLHFLGNEFFGWPPPPRVPLLFDEDRTRMLHARGEPIRGLTPGEPYVVDGSVAPRVVHHNDNEGHLGSFEFRYVDARTAVDFLEAILESPRRDLERTVLIASGGSHGADEALRFYRLLLERHGRAVDVVVTGDAFCWPVARRMRRFEPLAEETVGLNLMQTYIWPDGATIRGFYNIELCTKSGHLPVANRSRTLARAIGARLRLGADGGVYLAGVPGPPGGGRRLTDGR